MNTQNPTSLDRRHVLAAAAGLGATLIATSAAAADAKADKKPADKADAHAGHAKDAPPLTPVPPAIKAVIDATAECTSAGRVCLARCTDHLATGSATMAACQRAVMNMLAVTDAMATVATYRNADPKNMKKLAEACALFCRTCAKACEEHAAHHVECKACMDACLACAKACDGVPA
jgi:Cys-rich four helix bundle protein (predicted Tat secretion target)